MTTYLYRSENATRYVVVHAESEGEAGILATQWFEPDSRIDPEFVDVVNIIGPPEGPYRIITL